MKVGFVTVIREPWGGSEELWAAAAHELLDENHQVIISAFNTEAIDKKMQALVDKRACLIYRRGYVRPGIPVASRINKKINIFLTNKISNPYKSFFSQRPDVVVYTGACDSLKDDPFFLELIYKTNTPLIIIHQGYPEYIRTFDYHEAEILLKAFNTAKKSLFVADRNRLVMERYLAATIPNASIIRNPVNLKDIEPLDLPAEDQTQFAMVANLLINHKGHDIVFEILSSKKWKDRNWHLNIYGAGIDGEFLKRLAAFYKIEDRITFHGKVGDIKAVWKKNHVLLMPSRLEGIPLAVVEAMLCARPTIATDVAGHMEWIDDGAEGYIAEGANTYSFDNAMERAWLNKDQWKIIGRNAHERAIKFYDPHPGKTLARIIKSSK